jgi:hypothetical protein
MGFTVGSAMILVLHYIRVYNDFVLYRLVYKILNINPLCIHNLLRLMCANTNWEQTGHQYDIISKICNE